MSLNINSTVKTDLANVSKAAAKHDNAAVQQALQKAAWDFAVANPGATKKDFVDTVDKSVKGADKNAVNGALNTVLPGGDGDQVSQLVEL